jgi:acetolactate synthase-1/2/3 large subunit
VITLLDSIDRSDKLKAIPTHNEQGASIAAEAYSRVVTNGLGVAVATSGPGMLNLMQGIGCAYYDHIPALYITGAPPTNQLKGKEPVRQKGFQEMDVVEIVKPLTKYAVLLKDPEMIKYELEKLIYYAFQDAKGPVLLDLPDDLQRVEIDPNSLPSFVPDPKNKITSWRLDEQCEKMIDMILHAERPVIIVGGGVKQGKVEEQMKDFLFKTGIPFVTTWTTIDMFPEGIGNKLPGLVGNFGIASNRYGNYTVQNADLIISFGSRLDTHQTGAKPEGFAPNAKKICINVDFFELIKKNGMKTDLAIYGNLKEVLPWLNKQEIIVQDLTAWLHKIKGWKAKYPVRMPEYKNELMAVNPYVFMDELAKETGCGDIIITDAGATLTWTFQAYRPRRPQMLFSATNHSPMGYAICASIGAHYANPGERVVCITGDGGLMMNLQELETIIHNQLPIKIFLMNNGEYGIIKQTQDTWMNSRYVGVCPKSGVGFPDWGKICTAFGMTYTILDGSSDDDMRMKMEMVLDSPGPMFCDVRVKSREQILPKLVFGKPIEDMGPLIDRDEHAENMRNE